MCKGTSSNPIQTPDDESEALIGRIIDGEATHQEREHFERSAAVESHLWQVLALRQLDMTLLTDRVVAQTDAADRVEIGAGGRRWTMNMPLAVSGWAALLVVAVSWAGIASRGPDPGTLQVEPVVGSPGSGQSLTPDQHFKKYLGADYVIGELGPILLQTEKLGDGRHRLRFIRRIEEYVEVDVSHEDMIDEQGMFKVDRAELRSGSSAP